MANYNVFKFHDTMYLYLGRTVNVWEVVKAAWYLWRYRQRFGFFYYSDKSPDEQNMDAHIGADHITYAEFNFQQPDNMASSAVSETGTPPPTVH